MTHLVLLLESRRLCSLPGARRTQEHGPDAVSRGTVGVNQWSFGLGTYGHGDKFVISVNITKFKEDSQEDVRRSI